ncbi:MAG TPA: SRPBCC family protein [Ktedonobacteraceae bacterium]|nr:SRPBCC family protein [Ktedonobacteraceae bacterium]
MAHAESTITIHRPVDEVFEFVLDGTNNPKWRPAVLDIQRVPGKPSDVGAVYKQGLKGPGGRRIDGDYEITECQPNQFIKFQVIAGPARPTGAFRFESTGNSTQVTFTLDLASKGFARLMEPMITQTMRSEVATLANLKSYLEALNT